MISPYNLNLNNSTFQSSLLPQYKSKRLELPVSTRISIKRFPKHADNAFPSLDFETIPDPPVVDGSCGALAVFANKLDLEDVAETVGDPHGVDEGD